MGLKDFYRATTKKFDLQISYNGTYPNITNDSVILYMANQKSDSNAELVLTASADVSSSGSIGIARFNLSPTQTNISASIYDYEIWWNISSSNDIHILTEQDSRIAVLETIKD